MRKSHIHLSNCLCRIITIKLIFLGEEGSVPAPNGNISPRKGYTRAPYDDWRKPTGNTGGNDENQDEMAPMGGGGSGPPVGSGSVGGGWRTGPSSSGRR